MKNYLAAFAALMCCAVHVQSQTPFTYQGRLASSNGAPASGSYDLTFTLFGVPAGGAPVSGTVSNGAVSVSAEGLFSTSLDFGASIFDGTARWMEIAVRTNGSGTFSTLLPRQLITAAPYAIFASNAANASLLGGVSASGFASNTHTHAASQITSGTISPARGGTGLDTSAAASGSILRTTSTGVWTTYPPGGPNQVLKIVGGVPTWSTDADTTYTAGIGLQLSGTTFSVNFVGTGISNSVARSDHTHSADAITSGSIPDARLSNNIARVNTTNIFTASNIFTGVVIATNQSNQITGTFSGSGAALTSLSGANITAGTISNAALADNAITATKIAAGTLNHLDSPDGSPTNALLVNTNGLVSVGTNNPKAALHVASSAPGFVLTRTAEVLNDTGVYTNMDYPVAIAASGTLTAIASSIEGGVTIFEVFSGSPIFRSQFRDGEGVFTNLGGAYGVTLRSNLLAVAALNDDAVTLVSLTNPAAPVKVAELKDGVNSWNDLSGAINVTIAGNVMAIAAQNDNAVTLADISNPAAPVQLAVIRDGSFGYTNVGAPRWVAIRGNLLAIVSPTDNTVTLADISNPSNPIKLAELNAATGFPFIGVRPTLLFRGRC